MVKPIAVIATLLASAVIGASDPDTGVRREFMQAYASATTDATSVDSAALQAYELYPYLQAARFKRELSRSNHDVNALDQAIKLWLSVQGTAPVTAEVRRLWLLELAARQQWNEFQSAMPATTNDAELRCLNASAVINSGAPPEKLAAWSNGLTAVWLNANRLPAVCNAPFEWARTQKIITAELIEQRTRLALKAGNTDLARDLIKLLPPAQAAPLLQWVLLIDKPQPAIDDLLANPRIKVEPVALQDGWSRLARKDQDAAIARLPRLTRTLGLNEAAASPYVLSLALALSWNRRAEALSYFARVLPADMTEQAWEWQVRAALWAGDWPRVENSILAMPEALRTQARWRYWLARARQEHQDTSAAALYQTLVNSDDNYYAALAAAHLQQPYAPHALPLADAAVSKLAQLPGMQRVHELLLVQLRDAASAEWTQVFASLQPGEHLAAARLAHEWGWYDQAIATTAKLGLYNDYVFLYPQPYQAEVANAARLSGLPPDLIYAVMRQETLFRPDARSSANALGLLQLLPQTARTTARKFDLPVPSAEQLFDPAINVPLGALNLKSLLDDFNGQVVLALASYNAGPAAMRRWLPPSAMAADVWVENIPYNETRNYVQRVLWHSLVFRWLRETKPVATQAWLTPVQP